MFRGVSGDLRLSTKLSGLKFGRVMKTLSTTYATALSLGGLSLGSLSLAGLSAMPMTAHAEPPPEAFGQLPNLYDAALSPDYKQIALIKNSGGKYVVAVVNIDELGKPLTRALGLGKGVKPSYVKWVNENRVFIGFWQSSIFQGTPISSNFIYSVDTKTMKGKILVKPKEGVFRQYNGNVVDWLEDDPQHVLMAYDKGSNNIRPGLYRVNVKTGASKTIKSGSANIQQWITDNDGEPRIGQGRRDDKTATPVMKIRLLETNKWVDSKEFPGLSANVDVHGFTENPDEIIISDYRGKDTIGLYVYDLSAKKITRKIYHNDKYDASGVVRSSSTNEVIGVRYTGDTTQTVMLDEHATLMESLRQKYQDFNVKYVDEAANGDAILANVSGASEPGYMMLYEKGSENPKSLGALYPGLTTKDLGEVISVRYTARDGQKIPSYVTLPPMVTDTAQIKNLPFIVLPHGGPYGRDEKRFDYFAQFFASRGYGVLQMNFRGSDGYGKAYEEAGRKNWVVMQEDVEDGTRWLLKKGYADPKRTCIAGWSYGGYAALMGSAKNPELYSCAISMAGVTDIRGLIRDASRYRFGKASAKKFIGAGFSDKDDQKANSPVKIASDMTVPLFLAHGENDQAVDFSQYTKMKSALRKSKADVTYMKFKNEDHYLSNQENRQQFFDGLDKFLTRVNGKSEYMAP